jgi:uridine kinase
MNDKEKIQDLESKNIRLQAQHNEDVELLEKALKTLEQSNNIVDSYQDIATRASDMVTDILKNWQETIDSLNTQFLLGILFGILILWNLELLINSL